MCHFPIRVIRAIRGLHFLSAIRYPLSGGCSLLSVPSCENLFPSVSICVHLWFPLTLDTRHLALLAPRHSTLDTFLFVKIRANSCNAVSVPYLLCLLEHAETHLIRVIRDFSFSLC